MVVAAAGARVSAQDVFDALAGELAVARTRCGRLDGALGRLLETAAPEVRGAVMDELHEVDLLGQQIAAVSEFLQRLSGDEAHGFTAHAALAAVSLGEVAERVGRRLGHAASAAPAAEDVDFF